MSEAQQIAHLGSWYWDIMDNSVDWSDEGAEIFTPDNPKLKPGLDILKKAIHSDDLDRVMAAFDMTLRKDAPYDIEYRITSAAKGERCIHAQGKLVRDEHGKPLRMVGTVHDITERKSLEKELERQAHLDFLTGLNRRGYFMELAEQELNRSARYGHPLTLLMLDVDYFKKVNDVHGHKAGDLVLRKLAEIFMRSLRSVDIVGRIGGEEFAIMLPETTLPQGLEVAERLRTSMAATSVKLPAGGLPLHFTVSIGASALASGEDTIDLLLNLADNALYQAKKSGRNRVCAFNANWTATD